MLSNALNRSCLLLLSAHLEGFVEQVAIEVLERWITQQIVVDRLPLSVRVAHVDGEIKQLQQLRDGNKRASRIQALFQVHGQIWDDGRMLEAGMIRTHIVTGRLSNPNASAVKAFLTMLGVDIEEDLRMRGKQDLLQRITSIVELRNQIAHGDAQATTTFGDIDDYIASIEDVCKEIASAAARAVQNTCQLGELPW